MASAWSLCHWHFSVKMYCKVKTCRMLILFNVGATFCVILWEEIQLKQLKQKSNCSIDLFPIESVEVYSLCSRARWLSHWVACLSCFTLYMPAQCRYGPGFLYIGLRLGDIYIVLELTAVLRLLGPQHYPVKWSTSDVAVLTVRDSASETLVST